MLVSCLTLLTRSSADEHVQTIGPEHGDRHFLGPPRAQTAQKQHAGLLELDAQPSVASIRLPEGAAPKVSAPCRCGELTSGHLRGIGPEPRNLEGILIPGDGAAGDQGLKMGLCARQ